jgi:8-amino-3,8-dideoxy-alpha-D-manno-octulosonate transaminase
MLIEKTLPIRTKPLPEPFPGTHSMGDEEIEAVTRILRSRSLFRYYGAHPQAEVATFEAEFARFIGVKHVVGVSSGTAALHTALSALRVGPGQEVIVPAFMWVAVVAAVVNLGAIPVIADIDDTFGLNPEDVRRKITSRTAGILAVHMCGAPAAIVAIAALAKEKNLFLLEDCAQAVGASVDGRKVGSFGDMAIFSFQVNKNMTSGEAGAIVTNQESLYRRAVAGHDIGYSRGPTGNLLVGDEESLSWGRGCRLDELRAAILRVQLRRLPATIEHMRRSKSRIRQFLERQPEVQLRRIADPSGDTSCFLIVTFRSEKIARQVNERLHFHSITCAAQDPSTVMLADYGLHIYSNIEALVRKVGTDTKGSPWTLAENRESDYEYGLGTCPVADDLFARSQLLSIPSCIAEEEEDQMIEAFRDALSLIRG